LIGKEASSGHQSKIVILSNHMLTSLNKLKFSVGRTRIVKLLMK